MLKHYAASLNHKWDEPTLSRDLHRECPISAPAVERRGRCKIANEEYVRPILSQ